MESDFITDPGEPALADVDDDTSYADGDTLGKVWAFINQVGDSYFFMLQCCASCEVHRTAPCFLGPRGHRHGTTPNARLINTRRFNFHRKRLPFFSDVVLRKVFLVLSLLNMSGHAGPQCMTSSNARSS